VIVVAGATQRRRQEVGEVAALDLVGLLRVFVVTRRGDEHLAVLRRRHVVRTRREGQSIYYSLSSGQAASIMATLHEQFCRRS
jgi:hypothetical protein